MSNSISTHAIRRTLHFIWIGDESKRPDNCIQTWRDLNPSWEIKVWGNAELYETGWHNAHHINYLLARTDPHLTAANMTAIADMMRYEILYFQGGLYLDADTIAVRPLENWLFETDAFACWENEWERPGLIANSQLYSQPFHPFYQRLIQDIHDKKSVVEDAHVWEAVGPGRLTASYQARGVYDLTVYPSHFFNPFHFTGRRYEGVGPVFGQHLWGTTRCQYDSLHQQDVEALKR